MGGGGGQRPSDPGPSAAQVRQELAARNREINALDDKADALQAAAEGLNQRIGAGDYGSMDECLGLKESRDDLRRRAEALQSASAALNEKNYRLIMTNRATLGLLADPNSARPGDAVAGITASDYWYYLTHPDRMDSDLKTANKVAYGMIAVGGGGALAASAAAAGAGAALAGAVGGAAGGGIGSVGSQLTDTGRVDAGHLGVDVVAGAAGGALGGALLPAAGGSLARSIGAGAGGGGLGGGLAGSGHAALNGQPILPSATGGTLLGALVGGLFSAGFHGIDKALKSDVFRGGLFGKSCSAPAASRGVLENANYAQKTFGEAFSAEGTFAGRTVEDVAGALRSGAMRPSEVPIQYITRDGQTLMMNTRSAQSLEQAGIPRAQWSAVNMTGDVAAEARLTAQLLRNGLTSQGTPTVRPSGR